MCDVLADGTVAATVLVEPIYDTNTGARVATRITDPATGTDYTPVGEIRVCAASPDCESPTTPVTSVGLCLADGTPIAVTVTRDCTGAVTSEGWLNLVTGAWSAGAVPAGTVACGDSRSIQVSGTFCDIDGAGEVVGLVLVEYTYDTDGAIAAVRLVDAVTGDTYTPTGTVTVCPAGVEQPERDLLQLCDTATDGAITPFVRDYARDENGQITGHTDYDLDGAPYTPTGTVGVCATEEKQRLLNPVQFCFSTTESVERPGRVYEVDLPIAQGFGIEAILVDLIEYPAPVTWGVNDPAGAQFASDLRSATQARFPGATVTVTPPAISTTCGAPETFHVRIECLDLVDTPPALVQYRYNAGRDLISNPAFTTTPPSSNPGGTGPLQLRRADNGGTLNCTSTANRGWETNDVNGAFEWWGWANNPPGVSGINATEGTTPTPRATPVQEINAFGSGGGQPDTIWQTFAVTTAETFNIRVVVGGRTGTENITIKLSTGDVNAAGPGDIINTVVAAGQVTNEGGATPGQWTTYSNSMVLNPGVYTLAFTGPSVPGGGATGGLFTDMRVYQDVPGQLINFATDDNECTVTADVTTVDCQLWAPLVDGTEVLTWHHLTDGTTLTNEEFWAQVPAPSCCTADSTGGEAGATGNLLDSYPVCATVEGETRTVQRVVITDQGGGVLLEQFIGANGAPVTPTEWTPGDCGGAEACRDTSTVLVCDVPDDASTAITPTIVDSTLAAVGQTQFQTHPGPWAPLWSGGTLVYPAGPGPAQEHLGVVGQITGDMSACEGASGTLTISVRVRNDGPDAGQAWDGSLRLFRGTTLIAAHDALTWAPAGWQGTLTVSTPITAAEVAAGDIRAALVLETYHLGAKSWTADQFTATLELEGCEATSSTQFLRTLTTDCETGEVVSTTDTTLDGQPYTVTGTVGQCTPASSASGDCRDCEQTVLCDVVEDEGTRSFLRTVCRDCTGAVISVLDTELDGTTPYGPAGTVESCGPDDCPTTSVQTIRLCDLNPDAEPDEEGRRCAIPFLRHLAYDCSGDLLGFHDTGLDGTTPYTPVQVVDCQCASGQGVTSSIEVPWQTVSVVEDPAGLPQQDFIFTVSPENDPSRVGTVHVHVSRPAGGACGAYDINHLVFSNSATYTLTLDAVAQEMSYLRVDLMDFDTFEPVGIGSGTPEPTRLGGTAGWNPAHTRIVPAENNGVGYMYWDNPPETIGWTVFNTGGGTSCGSLSFQGMTVEPGGCCGGESGASSCSDCETVALCDVPADGDPVPFLRHICRDCEGAVTSVTDTTLDATTPYTPTAVVTDCGAVRDCPSTYGTECWELVTAQAAYDNTNTAGAPCGSITPNMTQCAGTFRLNSWIVDGVERVVGTPPQFVAVGCGGNANQLHGAWAAALAALDPGTDWQPAYNGICLWYVRTNAANPATVYGTMVLERIAGGTPAVYTLGSAQSSSRDVYTKTFVQECDGTTTVQWLDADGNEIDEPQGELTSCGSSTSSVSPTDPAAVVDTGVRAVTGTAPQDLAGEFADLQSVSLAVLAGTVNVTTSDGADVPIPAGVTLTWSVTKDTDSALAAAAFAGADSSASYLLNWTYLS
jgi:hypothetical protein